MIHLLTPGGFLAYKHTAPLSAFLFLKTGSVSGKESCECVIWQSFASGSTAGCVIRGSSFESRGVDSRLKLDEAIC